MGSPARPIRIHKVLSRAGIASLRQAERLIEQRRITISGQPVSGLGTKISPEQYAQLRIDGEKLPSIPQKVYLLLHKPDGYLSTTTDPRGRPTVMDLLPPGLPRLYPIGRLDFHTEGLLLLTNDGPLTHSLLHPQFHVPKVYEAKISGIPSAAELRQLLDGFGAGKARMSAKRVEILRRGPKNLWLLIEVREGKYHQVRRMCERIGHPVQKLKRVSFGPVRLGSLARGRWRWLKPAEISQLQAYASSHVPKGKKDAMEN